MQLHRAIFAVLVLGGCSLYPWPGQSCGGGQCPFTPDAAASASTCEGLEHQMTALNVSGQLAGTCETPADCTVIGGQLSEFPSCDCTPYAYDCSGSPVASNAPGLHQLQVLLHQYTAAGCSQVSCDCGPVTEVVCVDHHCGADIGSCFPPEDAGVDAPFELDAPH